MRSIVFWICLPLIVPQAIRVRQTAQRFGGAGGPDRGSVGNGPTIRLVAIGDSIIAGVGARTLSNALVGQTARELGITLECSVNLAAHGMIGADSKKVIQRLVPRLSDNQADAIVVSVGVNFEPKPEYFSADGFHPSEDSYQVFGRITALKIAGQLKVSERNGMMT